MKKNKFMVLTAVFLCILVLSACGKKDNKFSTYQEDKEAVQETGIESLSQLEQANDVESLLADKDNLFIQYSEYAVDAEVSQDIYAEKGLVITDTSDGSSEVYIDGEIYFSSEDAKGVYFNYPEQTENIKDEYEHFLVYEASPDEAVEKSEKTDMGYKLTTKYTVPKGDDYYSETFGIAELSVITNEYMLDENYVIQSQKSIYDGEVISEYRINFNEEKMSVPDYVQQVKNPEGETRNVTIVLDTGDDGEETEYKYTIPEDCVVALPENMDYREYIDAEHTQSLQNAEVEYGADLTVYLLKVK